LTNIPELTAKEREQNEEKKQRDNIFANTIILVEESCSFSFAYSFHFFFYFSMNILILLI